MAGFPGTPWHALSLVGIGLVTAALLAAPWLDQRLVWWGRGFARSRQRGIHPDRRYPVGARMIAFPPLPAPGYYGGAGKARGRGGENRPATRRRKSGFGAPTWPSNFVSFPGRG